MCKYLRQPKDLKVVSVINMVDDDVTNTIKGNLKDGPLVGELQNMKSEVIKEMDEVVDLMMSLRSCN